MAMTMDIFTFEPVISGASASPMGRKPRRRGQQKGKRAHACWWLARREGNAETAQPHTTLIYDILPIAIQINPEMKIH